jgi:hypothetical protein
MNGDRYLAIEGPAEFLDLSAAVSGVLILGPSGPRTDVSQAGLIPAGRQSAQAGGLV